MSPVAALPTMTTGMEVEMGKNRPLTPASATALTLAALVVYRALQTAGADQATLGIWGCVVAVCAWQVVRGLRAALTWTRLLAIMARPTGLYGRTSVPTAHDAEKLGLSFDNRDGNGIPLGGVGNKIIYYKGPAHISIRAATNAGKTESSSAPICFALGRNRNIIATAKGAELAFVAGRYRSEVLGQNVIYIDPWGLMKPLGLPSHSFNPIGHFPAYVANELPELIDKAFASSLILIPEAANASGENKIFRTHARELLSWCKIHLATEEHLNGELVCNLPHLKKVLGGSNDELKAFLEGMKANELFAGSVARAAKRFLALVERGPRFAESVISEALAALTLYDPAGALGRTTVYSDFDPRDLKTPGKPTSVYVVVPPDKTLLYGPHVGLCLNALIDVCIEADRFTPQVTVIADEFAACGVLPCALPTLFLGRSRGVALITYVQSTDSYKVYSDPEAFTTQAECLIAFSVRSTKDAEEYSKRSGTRSEMTESASVPWEYGSPGTHSVSLSEKGVPVLRPDELLQLPDFTAALFFKQHPPLVIDLVSYRAVAGWREHAKPMPGAPPLKDIPVKYRV